MKYTKAHIFMGLGLLKTRPFSSDRLNHKTIGLKNLLPVVAVMTDTSKSHDQFWPIAHTDSLKGTKIAY